MISVELVKNAEGVMLRFNGEYALLLPADSIGRLTDRLQRVAAMEAETTHWSVHVDGTRCEAVPAAEPMPAPQASSAARAASRALPGSAVLTPLSRRVVPRKRGPFWPQPAAWAGRRARASQ